VQASRLDQIDVGRQRVLQIREQSAEVEQIPAFIEVDQEIDVAFRTVFADRDGAKDANVAASMEFCQAQNLGAFLLPPASTRIQSNISAPASVHVACHGCSTGGQWIDGRERKYGASGARSARGGNAV
jgi:hypothetical protein